MVITAVERVKGRPGRMQVYADGVALFEASREMVGRRAIRPGAILDERAVAGIIAEDARRGALRAAGAMLARRPRSERDLRRRLAQRQYGADVIDETVARLRAARLIDDEEFARVWAESRDRTSPRGRRLVAGELRSHGVTQSIADDASAEIDDEEAAWRAAERRLPALSRLDDDAVRTRLAGFLQRRGFGWATVRLTVARALGELGRGTVTTDEPEL